ncbi:WD repeat protein [Seiridium cupressi]
MPYYDTADEWLRQSQLLLEARPTTTRVMTKYSIRPVEAPRKPKADADAAASTEPKPPRGRLVLKTFDSKTGTTLKYKTSKAAEVSRLILSLGKLGRPMAGLPELKEDVAMLEAPESGTGTPAAERAEPVAATGGAKMASGGQAQGPQAGGGGGKGKKKKGKR